MGWAFRKFGSTVEGRAGSTNGVVRQNLTVQRPRIAIEAPSDFRLPPENELARQRLVGLRFSAQKKLLAYFANPRNHDSMLKQVKKKHGDRAVAEVFKAMGHPARVRMLRALVGGEKCVCDLVEVAGLGWSTVSRHLSMMKAAGVLSDEKRGQNVIYRLELPCVGRFLGCLEQPELYPEMHASSCCGNVEESKK